MKVLALNASLLAAAVLLLNAPAWALSGAKLALPGQFPYQALIQPEGKATLCAGALIDPQWVLTAASCLNGDTDGYTVTLGAFDLSLDQEDTRVEYSVEGKTAHEEYNAETRENDIALLKLPVAVVENEFVAPIRLPSKKQVTKSFLLWNGAVSGWGSTNADDKTASNWVLLWFESRVEPSFWCRFRNGANLVHDSNICLSSIWNKGTCLGDTGNPLVITESDNKPTLLAIASDDAVSCANQHPPIFTKITQHLDWVSQKTSLKVRE